MTDSGGNWEEEELRVRAMLEREHAGSDVLIGIWGVGGTVLAVWHL